MKCFELFYIALGNATAKKYHGFFEMKLSILTVLLLLNRIGIALNLCMHSIPSRFHHSVLCSI